MKNTATQNSTPKTKSKGFIKFLSLLLLAGMAVGLFLPSFGSDAGLFAFGSGQDVFTKLQDVFANGFDFAALTSDFMLFIITVAAAVMLLATLFALLSKKAASFWFRIECIAAFAVFAAYAPLYLDLNNLVGSLDVIMIVGAVATVLMILQAFGGGAKSIVPVLCFILLVGAYGVVRFMGLFDDAAYFDGFVAYVKDMIASPAFELSYLTFSYIAVALLIVNVAFTAIQMGFIKTNAFTIFRYLLLVAAAVAALVMFIMESGFDVNTLLYTLVFAGAAFIALFFSFFGRGKKKKVVKEEPETVEEPEAPAASEQGYVINLSDYIPNAGHIPPIVIPAPQAAQPANTPVEPIIIDLSNYPNPNNESTVQPIVIDPSKK